MSQLSKVQTKKEFMDALYDGINPTEPAKEGSAAGRPTKLKTYLLESNSEMLQEFHAVNLHVNIGQTGLDHIKILTLTTSGNTVQFYMDRTDERFLILHTFDPVRHVTPAIRSLINSEEFEFDSAWLSTNLLRDIACRRGNEDYGFSVDHRDCFQFAEGCDGTLKPDMFSRMRVSGKQSERILRLLREDDETVQLTGYDKITIGRGTRNHGIIDDLDYSGRFRVVGGKSVDDHIILVNMVREAYVCEIMQIEECRIRRDDSTGSIKGRPLEFAFDRKVQDWNFFLDRIFNAKEPFRIWGIKSKIKEGFYRVLGVDTHTGHPLDIEIMDGLLRVYLPENISGSVATRLFANLQRFFDSTIRYAQLNRYP